MNKLLFFAIMAVLLFSCNEDSAPAELTINSLEEIDRIIDTCRMNEFNTRKEIEDNLIGEWTLLGIRSGWVNEYTTADITLNINSEIITLSDHTSGEETQIAYTLEFVEVNSYQYYYLKTNEDVWNNRVGMETFCNTYMYGTGRVDDGSTYLYAKVK